MKNALFNNSLFTFFRQLISIGFGFLAVIIIARTLGADGQGSYAFLTLIPIAAQTLLSLGIPLSTVYYIGQGQYTLPAIAKTNIFSGFIIGMLAFFLSAFFLFFFPNPSIQGVPFAALVVVLLTVVSITVNKNILVIFQGIENFKTYNLLAILNQSLFLVFTVLFLLIFKWGIIGAFAAFAVTHLVVLIISLIYVSPLVGVSFVIDKTYLKYSLLFGIKGHVSNVIAFFNYRIDLFLIAFYLENASIGLYSVAVSIVERIWVISHAISSVVYARLTHIKSLEKQAKLTAKVGRIVLMISSLLGVALALVGIIFIPMVFGNEYEGTIKPFLILIPGVLLISIARIFSNYLTACGKPEINSYIAAIVLTINVVLNILFIPKFGIKGAAWATTISYGINMILKTLIFKKFSQLSLFEIMFITKEDSYFIFDQIKHYLPRFRFINK